MQLVHYLCKVSAAYSEFFLNLYLLKLPLGIQKPVDARFICDVKELILCFVGLQTNCVPGNHIKEKGVREGEASPLQSAEAINSLVAIKGMIIAKIGKSNCNSIERYKKVIVSM